MSVSEKLKKSKNTPLEAAAEVQESAPKRTGACQKSGCSGIYIPANIGLCFKDGGHWVDVCTKLTCVKCGHVKRIGSNNIKAIYFWNGILPASSMYKDFNVPRELVEDPVLDKNGNEILDKDGFPVFAYNEQKKIDFIKKLLSIVDMGCARAQYFTAQEVLAPQQGDAAQAGENT